jgi:hypothetical protein
VKTEVKAAVVVVRAADVVAAWRELTAPEKEALTAFAPMLWAGLVQLDQACEAMARVGR